MNRCNTIEHYLTARAKECPEYTPFRFVAKHGQSFGPKRPLPKGTRRGPMQQCYQNAWKIAVTHGLIYVEGFARAYLGAKDGVALTNIDEHAWVVNAQGEVFDPTWPHGIEYFGIPFKREYAFEMKPRLARRGCHSLILNDVDDYPLIRAKSNRQWLMILPRRRHWVAQSIDRDEQKTVDRILKEHGRGK